MNAALLTTILLTGITVVSTQSADKRLTDGLNRFSVSLFKHLVKSNDDGTNIYTSPFSVAVGLSMLELGARGETEKELIKVFDFDAIGGHRFPKLMSKRLADAANDAGLAVSQYLLTKTMIYNDRVFNKYISEMQELFGAKVEEVDFFNNGANIATNINEFLIRGTNEMYGHLLTAPLRPNLNGILLSTAHLSRRWLKPFPTGNSGNLQFYNKGSLVEVVYQVPSMKVFGETFKYADATIGGEETQILELPFRDNESDDTSSSSMVIILPRDTAGLLSMIPSETFESDLNSVLTSKNLLQDTVVNVEIPKFEIEYNTIPRTILEKMGVLKVFTSYADLSRLAGYLGLHVNEISQVSVIDVNEVGVNVPYEPQSPVGMLAPSETEFEADHPFIFAIMDRNAKSQILFLGKVDSMTSAYYP